MISNTRFGGGERGGGISQFPLTKVSSLVDADQLRNSFDTAVYLQVYCSLHIIYFVIYALLNLLNFLINQTDYEKLKKIEHPKIIKQTLKFSSR